MLSKRAKYNRILASLLGAVLLSYGSPGVLNASEINQNGVPYQTATTINQNNNVFDISTTTTNAAGNIGINSFGKFNVSRIEGY